MDQSQEDRGILPVDPTQPDLSALARSSCAFNIPWPNNPAPLATLGSGFRTSELNTQDVQAPFQTQAAFSPRCLSESLRFREESGSKSTFHKAITSDAQSSAEHLSVSFSGGVGGKVLGASVSGKYNKDVTKNRDALKASIQATIRTGTVFIGQPHFSLDALADARKQRSNASTYFSDMYGDYYVGNLTLGADAGLLVSRASEASTEFESIDIKGKLRILWWDVEKSYHDEKFSADAWSNLNITAFDTLAGTNISDTSNSRSSQRVAQESMGLIDNLDRRVHEKMVELGLRDHQPVDLEACHKLFASGLVVEVTLLPYRHVRDYVRASNERG